MASSFVGPLLLVVCVTFIVLSFRRALCRRRDFARVRRGPLNAAPSTGRAPGSSGQIADAGLVRSQELLGALGLRGAPEINSDGERMARRASR